MRNRILIATGGLAAFGIILVALPGHSAQAQQEMSPSGCDQFLEVRPFAQGHNVALLPKVRALKKLAQDRALQAQVLQMVQDPNHDGDVDDTFYLTDDSGAGWLGVETQEVTSDKAKSLKLGSERGVLLGQVVPDSPAAKAGLKQDDIITEINGQRVEGAVQFRRMIHEIPAGRTAQLTVWRDGRSQAFSVTLGKAEERHRFWMGTNPDTLSFRMPEIPDNIEIPDVPFVGPMVMSGMRPRLGIDAEDLSGQLGSFFGAPDGEGILVREVNPGSPAEKAGLKAGDVITKLNDERVRTAADLREKLSAKRDDKSVKLGIYRNHSEMSLSVELPPPQQKVKHLTLHGTKI